MSIYKQNSISITIVTSMLCLCSVSGPITREDSYQYPECQALNCEEVDRWKQCLHKASFNLNVDRIGRHHLASIENNEEIVQKGNIYVILLNGEKIVVDYEKVHAVVALRQEICVQKTIEVTKQKLVYNGVELKVSEKWYCQSICCRVCF